VVVRKISGGSRSPEGGRAHAVITSVERSKKHYSVASFFDLLCEAIGPAHRRLALASILYN